MKCLLLINTRSGNSKRIVDNDDIINVLKTRYDEVISAKIEDTGERFDIRRACFGYGALAVCGGDGTFNDALNSTRGLDIELIYIPCGTLNDAARTIKLSKQLAALGDRRIRQIDLGEFNDRLFSYVAAAGSFTPIGYIPKQKYKKVFKRLVYYYYAFKEYKLHSLKARITLPDRVLEDTYTLILMAKSKYVFGFPFNRLYAHNDGLAQMLLIKKPEGFFKHFAMFFLFFRAFFIGFDKEKDGKYIKFISFNEAEIVLDKPVDFDVDGERESGRRINCIKIHKKKASLLV